MASAPAYIEIALSSLTPPGAELARVCVRRAAGSACPEPLDASPFSYQWTARHDAGALPAPPSTGHYALALSSLQEAKAAMDAEFQRLLGKAPAAAAEGGGGGAGAGAGEGAASGGGPCSAAESASKKARLDSHQ